MGEEELISSEDRKCASKHPGEVEDGEGGGGSLDGGRQNLRKTLERESS